MGVRIEQESNTEQEFDQLADRVQDLFGDMPSFDQCKSMIEVSKMFFKKCRQEYMDKDMEQYEDDEE